jgi:hypothetical protein
MSNERITRHIKLSIKLARECSRDSWQQPARDRLEYLRVKRESIADARYWFDLL